MIEIMIYTGFVLGVFGAVGKTIYCNWLNKDNNTIILIFDISMLLSIPLLMLCLKED